MCTGHGEQLTGAQTNFNFRTGRTSASGDAGRLLAAAAAASRRSRRCSSASRSSFCVEPGQLSDYYNIIIIVITYHCKNYE